MSESAAGASPVTFSVFMIRGSELNASGRRVARRKHSEIPTATGNGTLVVLCVESGGGAPKRSWKREPLALSR
ncbi:hypothetical protein EYF80_030546 [Liparis tanakae]|uniref:Uncharacterized protein n=1 Tax=Liparis tanakae TaxID=230148 RepID=A0A4Z2H0Z5_9TELE|nr:hypothetical protein EYF80_030546 [Liparis tanakae]